MSRLDAAVARLHPQAAAVLAGQDEATDTDLAALRRGYAQTAQRLGGPPPDVAHAQDIAIARGDDDGSAIGARYYLPIEQAPGPAGVLVWLHGGGWIVGDIPGIDGVCRAICAASGHAVLAVDYRLAPEHPFPAGLEDAWTALDWACGPSGAGMLAIEPGRVAVGGDSAGGQRAAALARRARDAGLDLRAQLLVYPALDPILGGASYETFGDGPFLTADDMTRCWAAYAGGDPAALAHDPDLAPLRAADLAGVAPAHIALAEIDPLRDDGARYARALEQAGVPVVLQEHAGMPHGFLRWAGVADEAGVLLARLGAAARSHLT